MGIIKKKRKKKKKRKRLFHCNIFSTINETLLGMNLREAVSKQ